jgi:membrane protein YdbS with pleckstrin-like domain
MATALHLAGPDQAAGLEPAERRPVRPGRRGKLASELRAGRKCPQHGPLAQTQPPATGGPGKALLGRLHLELDQRPHPSSIRAGPDARRQDEPQPPGRGRAVLLAYPPPQLDELGRNASLERLYRFGEPALGELALLGHPDYHPDDPTPAEGDDEHRANAHAIHRFGQPVVKRTGNVPGGEQRLDLGDHGTRLGAGTDAAPFTPTTVTPSLLRAMDLQSGERVIYQGHPSWRAILGFYLMGILAAVVIAVVVQLIEDTGLALLVFTAIVGITLLAGFVKRVATVYTITDRRLNIKRGIIARNVQETRLQRVQNVNFSQSVYERLMQIGNVDFDTAGTDDSNFIFSGVAQPEAVVEQVDRATHIVTGLHGEAEART